MGKTEAIITCQVAFYPLGTSTIAAPVREVLEIINSYDLIKVEINAVSTLLQGDISKVYDLLEEISTVMVEKNIKYAMSVNISNQCGC